MKENKFNVDRFGYTPSESNPLPVESSLEPSKTGRNQWPRRPVIACLVGSLLLMLAMVVAPRASFAQTSVGIFVSFGPPALPVYMQPPCPAPGYIWTPGYWAWDPAYGYYWVPGTWVPAPFVGALWTPGYWGWYNGGYMWYPGYWGTAVGYYGGINYGYGYNGYGYYGGYWRGGRFFYNRDVNRITNINIRNVYSQRVVERSRFGHVSYYGGPGGTDIRPSANQLAAARERRFGAINQQREQERFARSNPAQRARENRGRPDIAATPRPGEFRGGGIVRATRPGAAYKEPPREVRGSREAGRSAPAPVERVPSRNVQRQAEPNRQLERSAPAQPRNERPAYRNENPGTVQRNQREARPPEARRPEGRTQERNAHPQNQGKHKGENDHGPGRNR